MKAANNYTQWEFPEHGEGWKCFDGAQDTQTECGVLAKLLSVASLGSIEDSLVAHANSVRAYGNNENVGTAELAEIKRIDALG